MNNLYRREMEKDDYYNNALGHVEYAKSNCNDAYNFLNQNNTYQAKNKISTILNSLTQVIQNFERSILNVAAICVEKIARDYAKESIYLDNRHIILANAQSTAKGLFEQYKKDFVDLNEEKLEIAKQRLELERELFLLEKKQKEKELKDLQIKAEKEIKSLKTKMEREHKQILAKIEREHKALIKKIERNNKPTINELAEKKCNEKLKKLGYE